VEFPENLISGCFELPPEHVCQFRIKHEYLNKDKGEIDPAPGQARTDRGMIESNFAKAVQAAISDNVLYELGLGHALDKPVVLISATEDDVPFDLHHIRVIYYDVVDPFWGQKLIEKMAKNPEEAVCKTILSASDLGTAQAGTRGLQGLHRGHNCLIFVSFSILNSSRKSSNGSTPPVAPKQRLRIDRQGTDRAGPAARG
jgi:hypothetical protein